TLFSGAPTGQGWDSRVKTSVLQALSATVLLEDFVTCTSLTTATVPAISSRSCRLDEHTSRKSGLSPAKRRTKDRRAMARERHGLFRCGASAAARVRRPSIQNIRERYSDHVPPFRCDCDFLRPERMVRHCGLSARSYVISPHSA